MKVKIATIAKVTYEASDVVSATIPTRAGEITVLDRHIPLVSLVKSGVMHLKHTDGRVEYIAVAGGLLEVDRSDNETSVMVLADVAERGHEIDVQRVELAKERAREALKQPQQLTEEEYRQLIDSLATEEARLKAAARVNSL